MKRDSEYFGDEIELCLIYIAKRLKEALALEDVLTRAGVDYLVEPDRYVGGIVFRSERIGAFFYVHPASLEAARATMEREGYKPY